MRKIENNRCLFESNLNIAQCVLGLALTMFMSLPALWLSKDAGYLVELTEFEPEGVINPDLV